jgi:hypothetical protein
LLFFADAGVPFTPILQVSSSWSYSYVNISWNAAYGNGDPVTSYTLLVLKIKKRDIDGKRRERREERREMREMREM